MDVTPAAAKTGKAANSRAKAARRMHFVTACPFTACSLRLGAVNGWDINWTIPPHSRAANRSRKPRQRVRPNRIKPDKTLEYQPKTHIRRGGILTWQAARPPLHQRDANRDLLVQLSPAARIRRIRRVRLHRPVQAT